METPTDKAITIGIVVSELVTNACKYAYRDREPGDVRVKLRQLPDGWGELIVEDDGAGFTQNSNGDANSQGTGLGSRILKTMARSLHSNLQYDDVPVGTRARLQFQP